MTSKTKKQLRAEYGVSTTTLTKWLKSVPGLENISGRNIFTPLEVFKIYLHLGSPLQDETNYNKS